MEMVNNPDITFIASDDVGYNKDTILNIVNTYKQDFIVLNYDITGVTSVEELKETLTKIDTIIGALYDNTEKNSYSIIISSLFGMNKMLDSQTGERCNIAYGKVPVILVNNFINKKDYLINEGNISELFKVCYKCINPSYMGELIVDKKNFLYRLFFK